jgi:hypothetical protein
MALKETSPPLVKVTVFAFYPAQPPPILANVQTLQSAWIATNEKQFDGEHHVTDASLDVSMRFLPCNSYYGSDSGSRR